MPYNLLIGRLGNLFLPLMFTLTPIVKGVKEYKFSMPYLNHLPVKVHVFEPENHSENLSALLYLHGGAFTYKAAPHHKKLAALYAKKAGCKVFFLDYHVLPNYKYSYAGKEAMILYRYFAENADALGIDREKIGVAGDSAGGYLAAKLSLDLQKENLPLPCLLMLMYPVIDSTCQSQSMKEFDNTPFWNSKSNQKMWKYYLEGLPEDEKEKVSLLKEDIKDPFPNTYIETAQFDCLHDEGVLFAQKLKNNNLFVQLNETHKTFHGYDMALNAGIVRKNIEERIQFLKQNFNKV